MKILVTGFEAFGGSPINPSEQVLTFLQSYRMDNAEISTRVLPVDTQRAPGMLVAALHTENPDIVVCLGEASGRSVLSLERVAVNLLDFRIPDNAGNQIVDLPVIENAPAAYFSTLPLRDIQSTWTEAGIPCEISMSAGTYLCNQVFFTLMNWVAQQNRRIQAGFIHVPSLPEQVVLRGTPVPSMSVTTLQQAVTCLMTLLSRP